jgi:putative oxidoreductase
MKNLINSYQRVVDKHAPNIQNLFLLALRLWLAWIFLNAGVTKFNHWDSTLFLFEYEY